MVHFIDTSTWDKTQWYSWRSRGLGASEIGMLLVPSPWKSTLELHHEKLGLIGQKPMSFRMAEGHNQEFIIANYWEYWERDFDTMMRNYNAGRKVRKVIDVKGYHYNDKYPHLFCSLDREYEEDGVMGCLELKDKTNASYAMYEDKMNPYELSQLSTQILITERVKGELCYKIGGERIELIKMGEKDAKGLEKAIINAAKKFWTNVEKARIVMNQIEYAKNNYNYKLEQELQIELYALEPEPDNTKAYYEYLSSLAREKAVTVALKGDELDLSMAKDLKKLEAKRKKIELEEIKLKSTLCNKMRTEGKMEIDFGKSGKVSFFGGRFKNRVA